jgi:hypothetical protein
MQGGVRVQSPCCCGNSEIVTRRQAYTHYSGGNVQISKQASSLITIDDSAERLLYSLCTTIQDKPALQRTDMSGIMMYRVQFSILLIVLFQLCQGARIPPEELIFHMFLLAGCKAGVRTPIDNYQQCSNANGRLTESAYRLPIHR